MTLVCVAAQRGQDLYLMVDADTGVITHVSTATDLPVAEDIVHLTTLDGASDLLHLYGWRAHTVPISGVHLPRPQLAALAHAINSGDHQRRDTILRNAGRVPHTHTLGGVA